MLNSNLFVENNILSIEIADCLDDLLLNVDLSENFIEFIQQQSLTAGLLNISDDFAVNLIKLDQANILPIEQQILAKFNFKLAPQIFLRQVELNLTKQAMVAARSITSVKSDFWHEILNCGTQALGTIIFDVKLGLTRSDFIFSQITLQDNTILIARSSIFEHKNDVMLLSEVFLPNLTKIL